jgi:hypothetical protein
MEGGCGIYVPHAHDPSARPQDRSGHALESHDDLDLGGKRERGQLPPPTLFGGDDAGDLGA